MQTVALSESAVAVFRLRAKGLRLRATESRLPAYQELVEAGIMEPDGEGFRFTAKAWSQRDELLRSGLATTTGSGASEGKGIAAPARLDQRIAPRIHF